MSDAMMLGIAYSATIGGMATLTGAIPNYFLYGQDIVNHTVTWANWFAFALPISACILGVAYLVLWVKYIRGMRLQGIDHSVLQREYDDLLDDVGTLSRDEVLVCLITVIQVVLLIIRPYVIDPLVQTEYGSSLINDASLATLCACSLFLIPSSMRPGQMILTWPTVHDKFDFGTLLLIGGGMAINSGFIQSGLNIWAGDVFAKIAANSSHSFGLTVLIILVTSVMAQCFSAIGTSAAMLPVFSAASQAAITNPMALMLPATVACSFAFLLPTATPANVVVLAKSQELPRPLRVRDFFTAGLPLNLVAVVVGAALVHAMGVAVYDIDVPFPRYACEATYCKWLPIEGTVQGELVYEQACMVDDSSDDATCRLWNGTVTNVFQWSASLAPEPQADAPAPQPSQ